MIEKTDCVVAAIVTSPTALAPDSGPRTPQKVSSLARTNSPPTWATGNKVLTEQQTQRKSN